MFRVKNLHKNLKQMPAFIKVNEAQMSRIYKHRVAFDWFVVFEDFDAERHVVYILEC